MVPLTSIGTFPLHKMLCSGKRFLRLKYSLHKLLLTRRFSGKLKLVVLWKPTLFLSVCWSAVQWKSMGSNVVGPQVQEPH